MATWLMNSVWLPLLVFYLVINATTFGIYAWDKAAAMKHFYRIPERRLHLLALCGGWLGAWLAQQVFRHKTSKQGFMAKFWLTVVLHCVVVIAGFYWLNPT